MSTTWKQIWKSKSLGTDAPTLDRLLEMVGWKCQTGGLPVEDWLSFTTYVTEKIDLQPEQRVLEVGCGPGGFLLPLYQQGYDVFGIDYSAALLEICQRVMPNGRFLAAEASSLPFEDQAFDVVISSSAFQYFDDYEYVGSAVREMSRCLKPRGHGAVLDLNDAGKRNDFMDRRYARSGGRKRYARRYKNLPQLFFDRQWIVELGQRSSLSGYTEKQCIQNYWNNDYRFNYFFEKDHPAISVPQSPAVRRLVRS